MPYAPRVDELFAAPELAVLAVLEAAVDASLLALLAADPFDEGHELASAERLAARSLADAARNVGAAVNRYRLAVALARLRERNDEGLPF